MSFKDWILGRNDDKNTCPHCKQRFFPEMGVIVNKHTGRFVHSVTFCSTVCANEAYLKHLRSTEGL
jgi:hypothetical protein